MLLGLKQHIEEGRNCCGAQHPESQVQSLCLTLIFIWSTGE